MADLLPLFTKRLETSLSERAQDLVSSNHLLHVPSLSLLLDLTFCFPPPLTYHTPRPIPSMQLAISQHEADLKKLFAASKKDAKGGGGGHHNQAANNGTKIQEEIR